MRLETSKGWIEMKRSLVAKNGILIQICEDGDLKSYPAAIGSLREKVVRQIIQDYHRSLVSGNSLVRMICRDNYRDLLDSRSPAFAKLVHSTESYNYE